MLSHVTPFSQGNKVLDVVLLTLIILTRHTGLVLFTTMEMFGTKEMLLNFESCET
jgi:hypothetical protein